MAHMGPHDDSPVASRKSRSPSGTVSFPWSDR